jgi:hypothetical protein
MLRALEIFWLSLTLFCLVAAAFVLYTGQSSEAMLLTAVALISGVKYVQRRKQRKAADKR